MWDDLFVRFGKDVAVATRAQLQRDSVSVRNLLRSRSSGLTRAERSYLGGALVKIDAELSKLNKEISGSDKEPLNRGSGYYNRKTGEFRKSRPEADLLTDWWTQDSKDWVPATAYSLPDKPDYNYYYDENGNLVGKGYEDLDTNSSTISATPTNEHEATILEYERARREGRHGQANYIAVNTAIFTIGGFARGAKGVPTQLGRELRERLEYLSKQPAETNSTGSPPQNNNGNNPPPPELLAEQGRQNATNRLPGQWDSANYPKPPGHGDGWKWGPATGEATGKAEGGWRWFDPQGGEWRWHAADKWHPDGHWDYNPWTSWNSPWRNVYPTRPMLPTTP